MRGKLGDLLCILARVLGKLGDLLCILARVLGKLGDLLVIFAAPSVAIADPLMAFWPGFLGFSTPRVASGKLGGVPQTSADARRSMRRSGTSQMSAAHA